MDSTRLFERTFGLGETLHACPYAPTAPRQPRSWRRVGTAHLTKAPGGRVEARVLVLHPDASSPPAADLPEALGLTDVLPPETRLDGRFMRWVRPDARPGEVFAVTHDGVGDDRHVALHVLPRDPRLAEHMITRSWARIPPDHAPPMLRLAPAADSTHVMIRSTGSETYVNGVRLDGATLDDVLTRELTRKAGDMARIGQTLSYELDLDVARSTPAPAALELAADLSRVAFEDSAPVLRAIGSPANAMSIPSLSSPHHVSYRLGVRDLRPGAPRPQRGPAEPADVPSEDELAALGVLPILHLPEDERRALFGSFSPEADTRRLRLEVDPGGVRVGRTDEGRPIEWLTADASCAPYTVCRPHAAPTPGDLSRHDDRRRWDAARQAYASAFASLDPLRLLELLDQESSYTAIDLVVRDPNLTWQTTLDLLVLLEHPFTLDQQGAVPCEGGGDAATLYQTLSCWTDRSIASRELEVTLVVGSVGPRAPTR